VSYRTIVADPPWPMPLRAGRQTWREGRPSGVTRTLAYPTMSVADIRDLNVSDLAEGNAHLYLWTTQRFLRNVWDVAEAWGFHPSSVLAWCKEPRGFNQGRKFGSCLEFCLFAWRGEAPEKGNPEVPRNWFQWPRGRHSAKPPAFYDLVEQVSPGPYLEMFARQQRLGWDTWGHEALDHITLQTKRG
jgi:N6-adenosine-specific RNA methylase IME4